MVLTVFHCVMYVKTYHQMQYGMVNLNYRAGISEVNFFPHHFLPPPLFFFRSFFFFWRGGGV